MSFNHPVSELVSIIKNGYLSDKIYVTMPRSSMKENILSILKAEGYIKDYQVIDSKVNAGGLLKVILSYHLGKSSISNIQVVSKPGQRIYCGQDKIPLVNGGLGTVIMSTSKIGVCSGYDALKNKTSGEVLLKVS